MYKSIGITLLISSFSSDQMVMEYNIGWDYTTIILPLAGTVNVTIKGDGITEIITTPDNKLHT